QATNTWASPASMSVARNHCTGAVINGKFYVAAGRGSANASTALEVYDPVANSWSPKASMPTGRSGVAAAAVNGELYVFGGEGGRMYPEVEAYNPATDRWRRLPDMNPARHGIWASVIGNRIYVPGGATVEGFGGTTVNQVFIVDRNATFANISSRLKVETDNNVMIAGFILTGTGSKRIVVRGIGPSLPGVSGTLADPELELFDNEGRRIAFNNNWKDAPNRQEIADSALAPTNDLEAAILTRLEAGNNPPRNYTAVVRGVNRSTGVGLVEVYDLESGSPSEPANISTRGFVQTGENVLIGGLILTGNDPTRVVVRAIGPSLEVAGRLENPTLELRDSNGGIVAENDNWRSSQEGEIRDAGLAPANDLEAAIVRTLPAANYTAIVRGAGETSGVGLVEAYSLE
ncbi:MAG TPA: kelch repeat-containing protein, partial [Chthoniobacterales bacterium]|nr:kelch repeat-containing protein [Chthoniobacterales bacterium]